MRSWKWGLDLEFTITIYTITVGSICRLARVHGDTYFTLLYRHSYSLADFSSSLKMLLALSIFNEVLAAVL